MNKGIEKEVWVLVSPDWGNWNEEDAKSVLQYLSKKWGVSVEALPETKDTGHGRRRKFLLQGGEEVIDSLLWELDEMLC